MLLEYLQAGRQAGQGGSCVIFNVRTGAATPALGAQRRPGQQQPAEINENQSAAAAAGFLAAVYMCTQLVQVLHYRAGQYRLLDWISDRIQLKANSLKICFYSGTSTTMQCNASNLILWEVYCVDTTNNTKVKLAIGAIGSFQTLCVLFSKHFLHHK